MRWQRRQIGIGIGSTGVRVLAMDRGRIVGSASAEWSGVETLFLALEGALNEAWPNWPRSARPMTAAALGPFAAQARRISLPSTPADQRALAADLHAFPQRYFIHSTGALIVSQPVALTDGSTWASAFDAECVSLIAGFCRAKNLRLCAIATTADVLRLATPDSGFHWTDGDTSLEVRLAPDGELQAIRRQPTAMEAEVPARFALPLEVLGDSAWRFADAFGAAASAPAPGRLALIGETLPGGRAGGRLRLFISAAVCAACIASALLAPGLSSRRAARHSVRQLDSLSATLSEVEIGRRQLGSATTLITAVSSAANARRSMTLAIGALTRSVPASVFVSDLRIDSLGGTLVALGPRGASIVADLDAAPEVDGATLVGAVTPQTVDGVLLERATIRFRWSARVR